MEAELALKLGSIFREEPVSQLRTVYVPKLEIALEGDLTEASRIKKFGAVLRAISLLAGNPNIQHTDPAAVISLSPEAPRNVAMVKQTEIGDNPPKKKISTKKTPPIRRG